MRVVAEAGADLFQHAAALDIDGVRAIDDDVVNAGVAQQGRERAEAGHLILHILDQQQPFRAVERELPPPGADGDGLLYLLAQRRAA